MTIQKPRRPRVRGQQPVRSVRISDEVWERAKARADREGVTMSIVLGTFIEGYAEEELDLPTVNVTYHPYYQE